MLNIQCGENIDASFEELLDVKIAFGIPTSRHIAVRQLVDDGEFRSPFEKRINIHLFDNMAFVFDLFARDYFKPAKLFFGLLPPVCFDQTYHHIDAAATFGLCRP